MPEENYLGSIIFKNNASNAVNITLQIFIILKFKML